MKLFLRRPFIFIILFTAALVLLTCRTVPRRTPAGTTKTVGGIELVYIPGGSFMMGTSDGMFNERPRHKVTVNGFWMGKYEVTQGQYEQVMGRNPSKFKGDTRRPVESVTWYDAVEFCNVLSRMAGLHPAYSIEKAKQDPNDTKPCDQLIWTVRVVPGSNGFRLPYEAEWEYACRDGSTTRFFWGSYDNQACKYANVADHSLRRKYSGRMMVIHINCNDGFAETAPVGKFRPSPIGLHDMIGNVSEWCMDWYGEHYYRTSPEVNPRGPSSGSYRVCRGGSWTFFHNRPGCRNASDANSKDGEIGFRVVVSAPSQEEPGVDVCDYAAGEEDRQADDDVSRQLERDAAVRSKHRAGEIKKVGGMDFVFVPGGYFMMGSSGSEGNDDEQPHHKVYVSPLWVGKYEVTQEQYRSIMGKNPSIYSGNRRPVENICWNDSVSFCEKFSRQYSVRARLPYEAEWEYACRAGSTTPYYWGSNINGTYCWHSGNSGITTHPVGQKRGNAFGLHDITGNVWEWCMDWYCSGYYKNSPKMNPKGPASGRYRVIRGGSWYYIDSGIRSAIRNRVFPLHSGLFGFRIVIPASGN